MKQDSSYEEHIRIICKCEKTIDEPEEYLNDTYFENSELSSYFWDKGFDEAMILAKYFEAEKKKMAALLYKIYKGKIDTSDNGFFRAVEKLVPEKFSKKAITKADKLITR